MGKDPFDLLSNEIGDDVFNIVVKWIIKFYDVKIFIKIPII
jgi:hypothetical protein